MRSLEFEDLVWHRFGEVEVDWRDRFDKYH